MKTVDVVGVNCKMKYDSSRSSTHTTFDSDGILTSFSTFSFSCLATNRIFRFDISSFSSHRRHFIWLIIITWPEWKTDSETILSEN